MTTNAWFTLAIVEVICGFLVWGWMDERYKTHKRKWEHSRLEYDRVRIRRLLALRISFPIWGVASPIIALAAVLVCMPVVVWVVVSDWWLSLRRTWDDTRK